MVDSERGIQWERIGRHNRQGDRQIGQAGRQAGGQTNRTGRQAGRQIGRGTDK